jgi:hypothetical protein
MLRAKSRLSLMAAAIFAVVPIGDLAAQEPATVADTAKLIDLSSFPLMTGGASRGPRRLAELNYTARGDAREAYAFQKKTLEERGWNELPGGYLSDPSSSGMFGKDGFTISVTTSPGSAGMVDVMLKNLGNVDLSKLPVPPDAKLLYAFPASAAYVTEKGVQETSEALHALLTAQGWEPYGQAGDSLFFKKNAMRILARPAVAPAQGGKTMIQFGADLMSVELPAPPASLSASYADTTKTLSVDVDMTSDALAAYYKDVLGKAGWKATTEKPLKIDFREMLIFRNDAKDIATLKMQKIDGKLRATLDHKTAAEDAEVERLARAKLAERKAASARSAQKAAMEAAKNRVTVAISAPADAKDVKYKKDEVKFQLAAGKALAAVESIRDDLINSGWKGIDASLDPTAGTVSLDKKAGVKLVIVYIDTGFGNAEVTISAFGAEIEDPKAK